MQTFVRSLGYKTYKLKKFTDVDEFYDFQKMLKEMPTFASKHQLRLINWVNSIDEQVKQNYPHQMSYYCRTVKFTFISEFAKKSFISQLNSSVNAIDFERGLIQRIFFDTSENQIVQIFVWPDKSSADKRMKEIGDDLLQNLRESNVKIRLS